MTDGRMGLQAFREGRMREAVDRLGAAAADQELAVSQAVRFETLVYLGAALYAIGSPHEAVTAFENAFRLSLTPVPPSEVTFNLAHAYLAAGRRDAAREALLYLLKFAPGHIAAQMLLQRLGNTLDDEPLTGAILGESLESARHYLRTLNFASVSSSGYDPAQVHEALSQFETFLETFEKRLERDQEMIQRYEAEIDRYQQMEETLVQNLLQNQQGSQTILEGQDTAHLSPIELLFQKKP